MKKLILISGACLLLSACGSLSDTFSVQRGGPDEFNVVTKAPLNMPPDYELRPPQPGAAGTANSSAQDQARKAVFEIGEKADAAAQPTTKSTAEDLLLQKSGAAKADQNIRQTVNQEAGGLVKTDKDVIDKILFWSDPKEKPSIVDAEAERDRLDQNKAQGQPVTQGETPAIQPKNRGILDVLD